MFWPAEAHESIDILLTSNILAGELPPVKTPLLKLTDFGLARFIDPAQPMLATRCGSESYAAPELVTGSQYDGRQTDAWACGVVLFALAARQLPFDARPPGAPAVQTSKDRRKMLVRIANGEYTWPGAEPFGDDESADAAKLAGAALARSPGVRRVVARLLVRNPAKRSTMAMLWEDEWMWGEGAPVAPASASRSGSLSRKGSRLSRRSTGRKSKRREASPLRIDGIPSIMSAHFSAGPSPLVQAIDGLPITDDVDANPDLNHLDISDDPDEGDDEVEVEEHGSLLDAGSIGEIARQELS
jgi:serine/threonine protein kinase